MTKKPTITQSVEAQVVTPEEAAARLKEFQTLAGQIEQTIADKDGVLAGPDRYHQLTPEQAAALDAAAESPPAQVPTRQLPKRVSPAARLFEARCVEVAAKFGFDIVCFHDETYQEPYEDDGALHVIDPDTLCRASFDVSDSQRLSAGHQNRNTLRVLKELGLEHLHCERTRSHDPR